MIKKINGSGLFPKIISIIFHPVFVPTLAFAIGIFLCPSLFFGLPEKTKMWWLIIIAYITITFPVLLVFLLWRFKFVKNFELAGDKERYVPLIASMLFYFWVFWTFHKSFNAPTLIQTLLFGIFLTTVGVFIATIFFKISMHTAAWGCVLGFAVICIFNSINGSILFFIITLLIAGLVGTVRLYLQAHTPQQIYFGYLVGFIMQLVSYFLIIIIF